MTSELSGRFTVQCRNVFLIVACTGPGHWVVPVDNSGVYHNTEL